MSDFVFITEPDGNSPFVEEREYETDIFLSDGGFEQRSSGREYPNRRFSFSVTTFSTQETGLLEGMIRRAQGEESWIPYWQGARRITNNIAIGGQSISGDFVNAGFEAGQSLMLYRDHTRYERLPVGSVSPGSLGMDPATKTWKANQDIVVPLFKGLLSPDVQLARIDSESKSGTLTFDITGGTAIKIVPPSIIAGSAFSFVEDFNYESTLRMLQQWYLDNMLKGIDVLLDATGGVDGGPCLMFLIPPHSNVGFTHNPIAAYKDLRHIPPGPYSLSAKIKTSWDVNDPFYNDPIIVQFGGVPGIILFQPDTFDVGSFAQASSAAHNAWETLTAPIPGATTGLQILRPILFVWDGTFRDDTLKVWFDEVRITGPNYGSIVEQNLIFDPLDAFHHPGDDLHGTTRDIQQLSNIAGQFGLYPYSDFPHDGHDINLDFYTLNQIASFWGFYNKVAGAFRPFWIPSFTRDFDVIASIADDDTEFTFRAMGYTDQMSTEPARRQICFVRPDNSFLKRTILSCVDNGDGTETAIINEALGEEFIPAANNGVCFIWFVRFEGDAVKIEYDGPSSGTSQLRIVEVKGAPSGSGSNLGIPA